MSSCVLNQKFLSNRWGITLKYLEFVGWYQSEPLLEDTEHDKIAMGEKSHTVTSHNI